MGKKGVRKAIKVGERVGWGKVMEDEDGGEEGRGGNGVEGEDVGFVNWVWEVNDVNLCWCLLKLNVDFRDNGAFYVLVFRVSKWWFGYRVGWFVFLGFVEFVVFGFGRFGG